jgi:hypothetical protein
MAFLRLHLVRLLKSKNWRVSCIRNLDVCLKIINIPREKIILFFFSSNIWQREPLTNEIRAAFIRYCKQDSRLQFKKRRIRCKV